MDTLLQARARAVAGRSLSLWEGTGRHRAWTQLGTALLRKQRKQSPKETEASSGTGRLGVKHYAPALSSLAPLAPDPMLGQKCSITRFSETH